jgi:hypothetical protein
MDGLDRPELFDGRIGSLAMPAKAAGFTKDSRVVLEYVEYFKPDRFGSLIFIDERLKGFRPE